MKCSTEELVLILCCALFIYDVIMLSFWLVTRDLGYFFLYQHKDEEDKEIFFYKFINYFFALYLNKQSVIKYVVPLVSSFFLF